jgi:hypothetical protein
MTRKDLRTYRYQQMRLAFLADKTSCYWCGTTQRKLTIDHVVPVALMSDDTELTPLSVENWVASCLSCNAQRGAMLDASADADDLTSDPQLKMIGNDMPLSQNSVFCETHLDPVHNRGKSFAELKRLTTQTKDER